MPPDFLPVARSLGHRGDNENEDVSVFNYYFLFLAALGVLVALLLWWLHRRRRQRKAQTRRSGQTALAQDLEGWAGTRRFMQGSHARNEAAHVRPQEGLDENGEAPPPYQYKSEATAYVSADGGHDPAASLAVPLRTLSRDDTEHGRPPGYTTPVVEHGHAHV
jgi:hypothetical protein